MHAADRRKSVSAENAYMLQIALHPTAIAFALTVAGVAQEKGGGDETGPYDLVAGWPQNYCGEGFVIGSTAGTVSSIAASTGSNSRVSISGS